MNSILRKLRALLAPLAVLAVIALAPISASAQFADQATYIAVPGGTANAITLAVDNWNINRPGVVIRFIPAAQNTGATTVVVNGVGSPIALRKQTGNGLKALTGGELVTSQIASIAYDGTVWELLSPLPQVAGAGGYLTPCQVSSPSPVAGCTAGLYFPTGNVTSATTLFYEPVVDSAAPGTVPLFNGGQFTTTPVTEAQMTLILSATANTANNIYDVCVYDNAGTPAIGTMPAWSTPSAGAGARGTAAAITNVNGIWLNNITATVTNNNIGVTVAANRCTIVATIFIDAVNGQVTFHRTFGVSRKWSAWNFFNRKPLYLKAGTTSNYTTSSSTSGFRAANGSTTSSLTILSGLPEEVYTFQKIATTVYPSGNASINIGIGFNSTSVPSGTIAGVPAGAIGSGGVPSVNNSSLIASFTTLPTLPGINVITSLESVTSSGQCLFQGGENFNQLTAHWRG